MAQLTDLNIVKQHLRIESFVNEDAYLTQLMDAADDYIERATNTNIAELRAANKGTIPAAVRQAALLIVGHWYNQREAVAGIQQVSVPYALEALVKPYTKLV